MKKILVIDDDQRGRAMLKEILELHGYYVVLAEDGTEGVYLAKKELPSVILLDIAMADVDGIEVCKRIREIEKLKNVPVVMLSGMDHNEIVEIASRVGASGFIPKPYDIDKLLDTLKKLAS